MVSSPDSLKIIVIQAIQQIRTTREFAESPPILPIQIVTLTVILFISFSIATSLMVVPSEQIDGNPVPTIIFKGHPSIFHAFVILVSFAFNGALTALMMENQSKIARFCGYYSIASMASAMSLLVFAIFLQDGQQLQTTSSYTPQFHQF